MRRSIAVVLSLAVGGCGSPFFAAVGSPDGGGDVLVGVGTDGNADPPDSADPPDGGVAPDGGRDAYAGGDSNVETDAGGGSDAVASHDGPATTDAKSPNDGGSTSHDAAPETGPTCNSPSTPILDNVQGPTGGLSFEVAHNTTLTSFGFTGSGVQDTVELVDSTNPCEPLATVSIAAHISSPYTTTTQNVNWPVVAGKTYYLVNVSGQVAFYAGPNNDGIKFPWVDGELTVNSSVSTEGATECYAVMADTVWLAFTNLTFCP